MAQMEKTDFNKKSALRNGLGGVNVSVERIVNQSDLTRREVLLIERLLELLWVFNPVLVGSGFLPIRFKIMAKVRTSHFVVKNIPEVSSSVIYQNKLLVEKHSPKQL